MEAPNFPIPTGSTEFQLALALVGFTVADIIANQNVAAQVREYAGWKSLSAMQSMLGSKLLLLGMPPAKVNTLSWEQMAELAPDAMAIIDWYLDGLSPAAQTILFSKGYRRG